MHCSNWCEQFDLTEYLVIPELYLIYLTYLTESKIGKA